MTGLAWLVVAAANLAADNATRWLAVTGPEGQVGGVQAWVESTPGGVTPVPTQQGEDGRWQLLAPTTPAPPHTLWARGQLTGFVALPWPPPDTVSLPPPGTLHLTLRSVDPGRPLPATVAVRLRWRSPAGADEREVPPDVYTLLWDAAAGALRLAGLPFGPEQRYDLEVSAHNFAPVELSSVDLWTAERVLGTIPLSPAERLCGRVDSPDGLAEGEEVGVTLVWSDQKRRTRVGADGTFCFPAAPGGALAQLRAASQFRSAAPLDLRLPAAEVTITLPPLELLAGEVVDPEGSPVEECQIEVVPDMGMEVPPELAQQLAERRVEASCSPGGSFRLPRPWPGTPVLLTVTAPAYPPRRLPIAETAPGDGLRVVLQAGVRVVGEVREAEGGEGVQGAQVTLSCTESAPVQTRTDEKGVFTFAAVGPAGRCQGRVEHPDFPTVRETVEVAAGRPTSWKVHLRRGVPVRGTVLALPHAEPVPGVLVRLLSPEGDRLSATTDRLGRFTSPPLAAGAWGIFLEHEGFFATTAEVTVTPPAQPAPLTLWLERGLEVWGTVEGLTPPAQGAVVTLLGGGARRTRTTTGFGGVFRARGVSGGWTSFHVRHPSLPTPCAGRVWISPESPAPLTLSCAPPSVTLSLRLRMAAGQPVPAALLVAGVDASYRSYLCEVGAGEGCQVQVIPGTYRVVWAEKTRRQELWQGPVLSDRHLELTLSPAAP